MKKLLIFTIATLFLLAACQQQAPQQEVPDQAEPQQQDEPFPTTGGAQIEMVNAPQGPFMNGRNYEFSWRATGGDRITNTRIQASFSQEFSQIDFQSIPQNNGPGVYKGNIEMSADSERTVYLRAYAEIDGETVTTSAVERTLQAGSQSSGQQETQSGTGDTGSQEPEVQEINLEAYRYGFDPNPMRVQVGVPVRVTATSTDVDHGISIPQFGVSETLPAGETVVFEFTPDQTGEFSFFCNVFCGSGHSSMRGTLIVEE